MKPQFATFYFSKVLFTSKHCFADFLEITKKIQKIRKVVTFSIMFVVAMMSGTKN